MNLFEKYIKYFNEHTSSWPYICRSAKLRKAEKDFGSDYISGCRVIYVNGCNDFVFVKDLPNSFVVPLYHKESNNLYYRRKTDYDLRV